MTSSTVLSCTGPRTKRQTVQAKLQTTNRPAYTGTCLPCVPVCRKMSADERQARWRSLSIGGYAEHPADANDPACPAIASPACLQPAAFGNAWSAVGLLRRICVECGTGHRAARWGMLAWGLMLTKVRVAPKNGG